MNLKEYFESTTLGGGWCKHCGRIIEHHSRCIVDNHYAYECPEVKEI